MSNIVRISVSVDEELMEQFDAHSSAQGFPTRSEAIQSVMRDALVKEEWSRESNETPVAGAISLVYDHHKQGTVSKLLAAQHDFCEEITCSQHVHLDHENCMEIIVVRGTNARIRQLVRHLRQIKGLKHFVLTMSTTGERIPPVS